MNQNKSNVPESLYHYTSVSVLCKLFTGIKDGNLIFHASSVDFMNDSAEYSISRSRCKDITNELNMEVELGLPFALSFTESENNIPMWSMYANQGKGICLRFNFSKLNDYFHQQKDQGKLMEFSRCKYQEINTNENGQKPMYVNSDNPDNNKLKREMIEAAFIKPNSFVHEREWRLMVWNSWVSPHIQNILFKEIRNEICPYIEIPIPVRCLEEILLNPKASWQMIDAIRLMRYKYANEMNISVNIANITLKV